MRLVILGLLSLLLAFAAGGLAGYRQAIIDYAFTPMPEILTGPIASRLLGGLAIAFFALGIWLATVG
jgi:hypothetical protein